MTETRGVSRRELNRHLALGLGGVILAPGAAIAGVVTPTQVKGPFHPIAEQLDTDLDLTQIDGHEKRALGEVIMVKGRVYDTNGHPLAGALVDVWQANHHGRYSHPRDPNTEPLDPNFQGWGLVHTDADGGYRFKSIKPGAYALEALGGSGWRCRHIHFQVTQAGFQPLITQMYFAGDPLIEQDQEIAKVPEQHRHLLVSTASETTEAGLPLYRFDLTLASS